MDLRLEQGETDRPAGRIRIRRPRRARDAVAGVVDDVVSHLLDAFEAGGARHESMAAFRHAAIRAAQRRPRAGFSGRVLWVDDLPETIEPLLAALRRLGVEVDVVMSTKEAIDSVFTSSYAGVVSDMRREEGGVDHPFAGIELARALEPSSAGRPMLVYTGPRGIQYEDELRDAGVLAATSRATVLLDHVTAWARA